MRQRRTKRQSEEVGQTDLVERPQTKSAAVGDAEVGYQVLGEDRRTCSIASVSAE
jgi:hypothetical protein